MIRLVTYFISAMVVVLFWVVTNVMMPQVDGLKSAFHRQLQNPPGTELDVGVLADFRWTHFCVFAGHTIKPEAEHIMGTEWPFFWMTMLQEEDHRVVFLNGREVVATFDRTSVEGIMFLQSDECWPRQAASLRVVDADIPNTNRTEHRFLIGPSS